MVGLVLFAGLAWFSTEGVLAQSSTKPDLEVENLGDGRFRVGEILVDKAAGSFSVPATLLDQGVPEAPLEFLVVTKNGPKDYESLFEIEANAFQFNIACILIGLDETNATPPVERFNATPADGDPVDLSISWEESGKQVTKPIGSFLQITGDRQVTDEWVYIGSYFLPDGAYAAEWSGLAVGFVHDPESIIQHASGLGLDAYGAVTSRPVAGVGAETRLILTVARAKN
jgi:hypothetical protein